MINAWRWLLHSIKVAGVNMFPVTFDLSTKAILDIELVNQFDLDSFEAEKISICYEIMR